MALKVLSASAFCVFALTSCTTQDSRIALIRPTLDPPVAHDARPSRFGGGTDVSLQYFRDPGNSGLVHLSEYALLASMSYQEGHSNTENCDAVGSPGNIRSLAISSDWERDREFDSVKPVAETGRYDIPGLGYSVWFHKRPPRQVALVFRGTDFKQWGDWYTNFRWLTRMNPFTRDQYEQVRSLVPQLHDRLSKKYGRDTEVIAIGHSLGGGLAQHAAYSADWVKTVYAFNTSPVTGSTSAALKREYRRGVMIFRPYESGEILSATRYAARRLVPLGKANPKTLEIRFNFRTTFAQNSVGGNPLGQHRIRQLACDLVCWVDQDRGEQCRAHQR